VGVKTLKYSQARAKIAYHEFGVSQAEIAYELRVCTQAIAKAIKNIEGKG
jgi:predicted transcriptional regulator